MTAALIFLAAAAVFWLPSIIDRARRNRRARQDGARRSAECHANYWRDSSEAVGPWVDDPTPTFDALSFEFWERQMDGESA